MQMRTKLSIIWIMMLILAVGALGFRSIAIIRKKTTEKSFIYLHTLLSTYTAESVDYRQQLLVRSRLDAVPSYVRGYRSSAIEAAYQIDFFWSGFLMAYDSRGREIFSTLEESHERSYRLWEDALRKVAASGTGKIVQGSAGTLIYAALYYEPWDWYILAAVERKGVDSSSAEVLRATIIWSMLILILSLAVLLWTSFKFIHQPIAKLQEAAGMIAAGKPPQHIGVESKDELNDLARDMEKMAATIMAKEEQLLQANEVLEGRVSERTRELAGKNRELSESGQRLMRAVEELREQRDLSRMYLDIAEVMLVALDRSGAIALINRKGAEIFGYSEEELIGWNWFRHCLPDEDREAVQSVFDSILRGEKAKFGYYENLIVRSDGSRRLLAFHNTVTRNTEGQVDGVFFSGEDITERRKAAKEREVIQNRLNQAQKMESIGQLAGGIAHDFNNLLSGMFGFLELARENIPDEDDAATYLDAVLPAFHRAKGLTRQLLTFSKGGEPILEIRDLEPILHEHTSFALSGSKCRAEFRIPADLWRCRVDEQQLGQVVSNIVLNAVQAMADGGTIIIKAEHEENHGQPYLAPEHEAFIHVSFEDDGPGIPADIIDKVFDPFFTTKEKGHGLGLATSYSIIRKHQGILLVKSAPGTGATFHIYLPKADGVPPTELPAGQHDCRGSGQILIMDDEPMIRAVQGSLLRSLGFDIIEASGGKEVLAFCSGHAQRRREASVHASDPAAAFFDLTVPGDAGGSDIIAEVRLTFPRMPIFAVSGYSDDAVMANPGKFDFTDSLTKPFRKGDLTWLLTRHGVCRPEK